MREYIVDTIYASMHGGEGRGGGLVSIGEGGTVV
jgi:hypothetical protein